MAEKIEDAAPGVIPEDTSTEQLTPVKTPNTQPSRLRRFFSSKFLPWVLAGTTLLAIETIKQTHEDNRHAAERAESAAQTKEIIRLKEQLDHFAKVTGQSISVDGKTLLGTNLRPVEKLPAWGELASPELHQAVTNSSVSLLVRNKSTKQQAEWSTWCSGNIVSINQQRVVETAATCFQVERDRIKADTPELKAKAFEVGSLATWEYAVVQSTPEPMSDPYTDVPLGYVRNIAVTPGGHTALLGIDTTSRPVVMDGGAKRFDALPALTQVPPTTAPAGGQEAFLTPRLKDSDNARKAVSGIFLGVGEKKDPPGSFFVAGLYAKPPESDGCGHGALGALASGVTLGPAYERINPYAYPNETVPKLQAEDVFHVDTSHFQALCKFDNPTGEQLSALLGAFGHAPEPALVSAPK